MPTAKRNSAVQARHGPNCTNEHAIAAGMVNTCEICSHRSMQSSHLQAAVLQLPQPGRALLQPGPGLRCSTHEHLP